MLGGDRIGNSGNGELGHASRYCGRDELREPDIEDGELAAVNSSAE